MEPVARLEPVATACTKPMATSKWSLWLHQVARLEPVATADTKMEHVATADC